MKIFVLRAAAVGAWLLVAGPLFQGLLELWDIARSGPAWTDRKRVDRALWLAPPVLYLVQLARLRRVTAASTDKVSPNDFSNRATGWFAVSAGALLVAVKESWDLTEAYELSLGTYWVIVAPTLTACQMNVTVRMLRLAQDVQEPSADQVG